MADWTPASDLERTLESLYESDMSRCLALLRDSEFVLPISAAAASGNELPAWATASANGATWVAAFTSMETMHAIVGADTQHARISSIRELAAAWPDATWGLGINIGTPIQFLLESGTVARLAAPTLSQSAFVEPWTAPVVMQKLIRPAALADYFIDGTTRVSGYVHRFAEVAHIATSTVLAAAVGVDEQEFLTPDGSLYSLRWFAVGDDLYPVPLGGVDEQSRDAVAGWVIEDAPFVGTGFGPNLDQVVRIYKVAGIGLPHGAEIWELDIDGVEHRRGYLDGDRSRWLAVTPKDDAQEDAHTEDMHEESTAGGADS